MPLTLIPGFAPSLFIQKSETEYFWSTTKVPQVYKPPALPAHLDSPTRCQILPDVQRRENVDTPIKQKRELYLPLELWGMIVDQANCSSTLAKLCHVSRKFYYLATPKLYRQLALLYMGTSDVRLVNFAEASIKDATSLQRRSTLFTGAHWNHIRHVRDLIVVSATSVPSSIGSTDSGAWLQRRACPNPDCQKTIEESSKLAEILHRMSSLNSIAWLIGDHHPASMPAVAQLWEVMTEKHGDSLEKPKAQVSNSSYMPNAINKMGCLKELEHIALDDPSADDTIEAVGKYLRSSSGESIRSLRIDRRLGASHYLDELLGFDAISLESAKRLDLESLHLKSFLPGKVKYLSTVLNPTTLTSITFVECPSLAKLLTGQCKGAITFPNLKSLHLLSAYVNIPAVFNELPVLEELVVSVDARLEQLYNGGITRYLRRNGHGLRRLGILFRTESPTYIQASSLREREFMGIIRNHCQNLEELGVWNTDMSDAESMITHLPRLRAVSLGWYMLNGNNYLAIDERLRPFMTSASGIAYIFTQTDYPPYGNFRTHHRSQLTYIRRMNKAWRRVTPEMIPEPTDYVMPLVTVRELSRTDPDIPQIFLVEDFIHCHREVLWGSEEKLSGPVQKKKFWALPDIATTRQPFYRK